MIDFSEKNLLAIDTSGRHLKLAVSFGGDRLVKSDELIEKSHGQFLLKKIAELFQSAGLEKSELDAIIVATGPGSFTGLRIGIAAAKGMAVVFGIPIAGVSLFDIAAYRLKDENRPVSVIVPLKRDEFFVAEIHNGEYAVDRIQVSTRRRLPETVKDNPVAVFGADLGDELTNEDLSNRVRYDIADLIYLGGLKLSSGAWDDLAQLEPMYVQKSQAEINFELRNRK